MYRNRNPQPPAGGGMQALRGNLSQQQGRSEMGKYSGPDARPAGNPGEETGFKSLKAMLTQKQPQGQMPPAPEQGGPPAQPAGPTPNDMAMNRANEHARFMGRPPASGTDALRQQMAPETRMAQEDAARAAYQSAPPQQAPMERYPQPVVEPLGYTPQPVEQLQRPMPPAPMPPAPQQAPVPVQQQAPQQAPIPVQPPPLYPEYPQQQVVEQLRYRPNQ